MTADMSANRLRLERFTDADREWLDGLLARTRTGPIELKGYSKGRFAALQVANVVDGADAKRVAQVTARLKP